jgi:beta-RFAP synthase
MKTTGMRIRTSSRLHFGLLGWGGQTVRQFGGLGLMIDSPALELRVTPNSSWRIDPPHRRRLGPLIDQLEAIGREREIALQPAQICVDRAPPEHVGLGVGTQLSLAVARAVLELSGVRDIPVTELARWAGRGRRSGIGLHGFELGGLIVDGGRKNETDIPPLVARLPFPDDWSILIARPPGERGLHGPDENRAFAERPAFPTAITDALCRLVLLEILPAVIERDLPAFGAALSAVQARVGAYFADSQGGVYSAPGGSRIAELLRRAGFEGVGQSSWGPTLYAFSALPCEEIEVRLESLRLEPALDGFTLSMTQAANHGAVVSSDE